MASIMEKNFTLDGCSIHALEAGPLDGPTVILLHGMKFQAQTWRELGTLDALAGSGMHVLAIDMPGFGQSPEHAKPPGEVLTQLMKKCELEQVILVGPSMGGRIALEFAIAHPESIKALVVVGPVGVEENRAGLSRITAPVLVIWGEEDQVSPIAHSETLLDELADARREIYPQAPHPCYLEQPDRWHASLKKFLTDSIK